MESMMWEDRKLSPKFLPKEGSFYFTHYTEIVLERLAFGIWAFGMWAFGSTSSTAYNSYAQQGVVISQVSAGPGL